MTENESHEKRHAIGKVFDFNVLVLVSIEFQFTSAVMILSRVHTILILEKFSRPSGVKSGVPSSINDKSVRYMPKYGMHGGSHRCKASRIARKRPSEQTTD